MDGFLRQRFRQNLREAQWTSIETGATAAGVPDSEFIFPGGCQGWIEFKRAYGSRVRLRPEQVGWLLTRSRMGGRCFVAVRSEEDLYLYFGGWADSLLEMGLKLSPTGRWSGRWDWREVRGILTR